VSAFPVGSNVRNVFQGQTESTPCASPEPTPEPPEEDELENSAVDTGAEKQEPEQRQNSSQKIVQVRVTHLTEGFLV